MADVYNPVPTVAPSVPGPVYQNLRTPQVSPATFGAQQGEALEQVGQGLKRTADFYGEAVADDATTQYQERVNKLLRGDPSVTMTGPDGKPAPDTGFLGLKGRAAMEARPALDKQMTDLRQQIRGNLKSTSQTLKFDADTRRFKAYADQQAGDHADRQSTAWYSEVNKARSANGLQHVANNADNPAEVQHGLDMVLEGYIKQAQLQGGGDELEKQAWGKAHRDVLAAKVNAIAVSDPQRALRILQNEKDTAGIDYDNLYNKIKPHAEQQTGADIGRRIGADTSAVPAGGATPTAVHTAIVGHESGGQQYDAKGNVLQSDKGAFGIGQMIPETFKKYALPGERIDNKDDNLAASRRAVDDYYRKYNGDWQRVAVAYFSGEGNVAPPGSPQPYKNNSSDGHNTVSQYIANVGARLGPAAAPQPTPDANLQAADAALHLTPQEKYLWQHHADMLAKGGLHNADGSTSTLSQISFERDGKTYNIPTVWADANGHPQRLSNDDSIKRAEAEGLDKFPAYGSEQEAEDRYNGPGGMHSFLEKDMAHTVAPSIGQQHAAALDQALNDPYLQTHPTAQNAAIAQINHRFEVQRLAQTTSTVAFNQRVKDTMAEAATTGSVQHPISEQDFSQAYGPDKGNEAWVEYQGALQFGSDKKSLGSMSPEDVKSTMARTPLPEPGPGYAAALRRRASLKAAADAVDKERQEDMGKAAIAQMPAVKQAWDMMTTPNQPPATATAAAQHFAAVSIAEQERVGIPPEQRHVLPAASAEAISSKLMASPEPKQMMNQMQAQWGQAWPQVFRDLVIKGKLSPMMQAVGGLPDLEAAQLTSWLKGSEKTEGKTTQEKGHALITKQFGASAISGVGGIDEAIRGDADLQKLAASWRLTGGPAATTWISGMIDAVHNLAYAKANQTGSVAGAAAAAVKAFTSNYEFMPSGALVPAKQYDTVVDNSMEALRGLSPSTIAIPPLFGQPGQPTPQEYIGLLQTHPQWVTNPSASGLWLMDHGGKLVRDKQGQPFELKFDAPRLAPKPDTQFSAGQALP